MRAIESSYLAALVGALLVVVGHGRDAAGKPFRPFVDRVGVTGEGTIVTTTTAMGQADDATPGRHQVSIFGRDGALVSRFDAEQAHEAGVRLTRRRWRALDRWITSFGSRRVEPRPLIELRCHPQPDAGETACPSDLGPLVRTPLGIGRWNPSIEPDTIWAWGTPEVAEVGEVCVLLLPDNRGFLDRTVAEVAPCPPPL